MRPRLQSAGLVIATLLLSFYPVPATPLPADIAQAQTVLQRKTEAENLLGRGERQVEAEQYEAALQSYEQALKIYQEIKDAEGELSTLEQLGDVYSEQDNHPKVIEYAQKTLQLARKIKDYRSEYSALRLLYNAYRKLADYGKAVETAEQMLDIAEKHWERKLASSRRLLEEAQIYLAGGSQAEALKLLERGEEQVDAEQYEAALQSYEQALKIYQEIKDAKGELSTLEGLDELYSEQDNHPKVIEYAQQRLQLARKIKDSESAYSALSSLYKAYQKLSEYGKAFETAEQMLVLAETQLKEKIASARRHLEEAKLYLERGSQSPIILDQKNQKSEANRLLKQGDAQRRKRQYEAALQFYQQALKIYQGIQYLQGEAEVLYSLERIHYAQDNTIKIIEYAQKRLEIARKIQNSKEEENALKSLYKAYRQLADYGKAIETAEQIIALEETQKPSRAGSRRGLEKAYSYLEQAYADLGDQATVEEFKQKKFLEVVKLYQQELSRAQEGRNWKGEIKSLGYLGRIHLRNQEFGKAIKFYEQGLKVAQVNKDQEKEITFLLNLGEVYGQQGDFAKAVDFYQQGLTIIQTNKDRDARELEIECLLDLVKVYVQQGNSAGAADSIRQASKIAQELGDDFPSELADIYSNLGEQYYELSDYSKAIEYYQQALAIFQKNPPEEDALDSFVELFVSLGNVYKASGNYPKALEYYQKALRGDNIAPEGCECLEELIEDYDILNELAEIYIALGEYTKAIDYAQQQLTILRKRTSHRFEPEKEALHNLGLAYQRSGNDVKALEAYGLELAISQAKNDRNGQINALNSIANLFTEKDNPELAIVFYKKSVNVIETIRQGLQQLPKRSQEAYTQKVEGTYRQLADLLLSQKRILEAQQVLELLKIQEIRNYTREARTEQTSRIATNPVETKILQTHGTLIAFGQKVAECEQANCTQLSQLRDQRETISEEFYNTVKKLEQTIRGNREIDDSFIDPNKLFGNPDQIVSAQPGTVLIYTLVLPDKLWVLWASKGGITKSIEVPGVGQKQLSETILKFRQLLQNPHSDIQELQATSKQLYSWLIPSSLQAELNANSIQHLVFSLDHVTRYIPMAALFDGKKYLTEDYTISTIISANTNMGASLSLDAKNTSVLALGLSEAKAGFNPLPNVPLEIDTIVRQSANDRQGIYPGIERLNQAFDWRTLRDNLTGKQILHIATHGKFEPGSSDASFLLLGDGEKLPISKIATLRNLNNLHLVVLSACETALGGTGQDGTEISGISSYFLNSGAKAVAASLWAVNDASTSQLMQQFYNNLAQGTAQKPVTKAEALRQAQLALLQGKVTAKDTQLRSDLTPQLSSADGTTRSPAANFSHPYYWAPFILIGNGL